MLYLHLSYITNTEKGKVNYGDCLFTTSGCDMKQIREKLLEIVRKDHPNEDWGLPTILSVDVLDRKTYKILAG